MKPTQLLTVEQTAERLSISSRTVGRMYRSGQIPHVRVRGRVLINSKDVEQYIENHYYTEAM